MSDRQGSVVVWDVYIPVACTCGDNVLVSSLHGGQYDAPWTTAGFPIHLRLCAREEDRKREVGAKTVSWDGRSVLHMHILTS